MIVSVVIPTYQRAAAVRRVLDSLRDQTIPANEYEALVVVDGSTDGTVEVLAGLRPPFELHVASQPNRGRAAARNVGIGLAAGDVVVLLDDDMVVTRGLLEAHARRHGHGLRGVVGPVELLVPPDSPPVVSYMAAYWRRRMERLSTPGYRLRFADAYTGNFSAPRALLAELRFDEEFTRYGHEDYELALRLVAAGATLEFEPAALAYHAYAKDLAALARDELERGRTAVLLARKHPHAVGDLQLAHSRSGSRSWRAARELFIRLALARPELPPLVLRALSRMTRRRLREGHYHRITDYFFWLGARQAVAEESRAARATRTR